MKAKMNADFWNDLNFISKGLMILGLFFVDLAFRLSGLKQEESK